MKDLQQKLLATFRVEAAEHLQTIRSILAKREQPVSGSELDEAFRHAHSLKGAARAVDLEEIERLAHRLETLFSRVREGRLDLTAEVVEAIGLALDGLEDAVASLEKRRKAVHLGEAVGALERLLHAQGVEAAAQPEKAEASANFETVDTVRVRADHLDRLLRAGGQVISESLHQHELAHQMGRLAERAGSLQSDWERFRSASLGRLRRLEALPEFAPLLQQLTRVEHQVRSLSQETRSLHLRHRAGAWSLLQTSGQFQREVRMARMVPASSVFEALGTLVRDLARDEGKTVNFQSQGLEVEADRAVLQTLKDPLLHLLRNAVSHGIEKPQERESLGKRSKGLVRLELEARGNRLLLQVEDDGQGIDLRKIARLAVKRGLLTEGQAAASSSAELSRLLFEPGFSTSTVVTELAGRGMGLSIVYEAVTRLQGEARIESREKGGTRLILSVPLWIASQRLLLVRTQGQRFGIPVQGIERLHRLRFEEIQTVEGRPALQVNGQQLALKSLASLLNLAESKVETADEHMSVVILKSANRRVAVVVDEFLEEREALVQDLGPPLNQLGNVGGGIILGDGSVCLVLNPVQLLESFKEAGAGEVVRKAEAPAVKEIPRILVVDDSITTRTLEKSILEAYGYRVLVAVDGVEAIQQLSSEQVDLVVADIQMPRMDGFTLLQEMKRSSRFRDIPVVLVTSMESPEDQRRGLELGADAYILKRKFDQKELLQTIEQLL